MHYKMNQTIDGVSKDLESFSFNTVISKLMELNNAIEKENISKESFSTFLKLLFPACPHIAEELWEKLGFDEKIKNQEWPKADKNYLVEKEVNIAIQINGKTKGLIKVAPSAPQSQVEEGAKKDKRLQEILEDKSVKKIIYVAGRIINFVVE
ncbi:MAG: Leucine-tRNA ligase [Berkelbacteria bacterium GW2011_GWB1_38_5]|nr:MAG: Leucine-tRNA ligase [Berkelbacteria bacterium GW2011_GWB1_38_5]